MYTTRDELTYVYVKAIIMDVYCLAKMFALEKEYVITYSGIFHTTIYSEFITTYFGTEPKYYNIVKTGCAKFNAPFDFLMET